MKQPFKGLVANPDARHNKADAVFFQHLGQPRTGTVAMVSNPADRLFSITDVVTGMFIGLCKMQDVDHWILP